MNSFYMEAPSPPPSDPARRESSLGFFFLCLYTALVLIRPHEMLNQPPEVPFIQIIAILTFALTVLGQRPLVFGLQQGFLLTLIPIIVISGVLNGWGGKGIEESQSLIVATTIPMFLYSTLLSSAARQEKIMALSILASLLMVHNGWVQQRSPDLMGWAGVTAMEAESRIRYLGFFRDPNDLGMLIVMNIPFVGYFYSRGSRAQRIVCSLIFIFFCYGTYMTGSRGTILGALAVIAFFLLLKRGSAMLIFFAVLAGPVAATLLTQFGGLSSGESSAALRIDAWYEGILLLVDNPVLGVGKDNFYEWHGRTAHNSFILVASELGGLGYSLWGGAIVMTVFALYVMTRRLADTLPHQEGEEKNKLQQEAGITMSMLLAMVGYLATAFFLSRAYTLILYIFMGLSIASGYRVTALVPDLRWLTSTSVACFAILASWGIIVLVWLAIKFA